jgi:hypothetical protein
MPHATPSDLVLEAIRQRFPAYMNYDKVDYKGANNPIVVTCPIHGDISIIPKNYLKTRYACPKCKDKSPEALISAEESKAHLKELKRLATCESFIERSKEKYGRQFSYEQMRKTFVDVRTPHTLTCSIHGDIETKIRVHLDSKYGCKECGYGKMKRRKSKLTLQDMIAKAKKVHPNNHYDYSQTTFENIDTPIQIRCNRHDKVISTTWYYHINRGFGCKTCNRSGPVIPFKEIERRGNKYHKNKYTYDESTYVGTNHKMRIICPDHGEFWQTPNTHNSCGCPKCVSYQSKLELEVLRFIEANYDGPIIQQDRECIEPYELDIYLPELKLAIEVNSYYTHAYQSPPGCTLITKPVDYHQKKHALCREKGIRLIQIWDMWWSYKQERYVQMLLNALGHSTSVYARKCEVEDIPREVALAFFREHSFHETRNIPKDCVTKGLFHDNILVMACAYNHKTCQRMASADGIRVVGGVSRLLKDAPAGMTYFTTNDSGSIIHELPGFESVPYKKRRGYLYRRGDKPMQDIWITNKKAEDLTSESYDGSPNWRWNVLVANGWFYVVDSGLTKFVKLP